MKVTGVQFCDCIKNRAEYFSQEQLKINSQICVLQTLGLSSYEVLYSGQNVIFELTSYTIYKSRKYWLNVNI